MARNKISTLAKIALTTSLLGGCKAIQGPESYTTNTGHIGPSTKVINPEYTVELLRTREREYIITQEKQGFMFPNGQTVYATGIAPLKDATIFEDHENRTVEVRPKGWYAITEVDVENGVFVLADPANPRRESVDLLYVRAPSRNVKPEFGFSKLTPQESDRIGYFTAKLGNINNYIFETTIPFQLDANDPSTNIESLPYVFAPQAQSREFREIGPGKKGIESFMSLAIPAIPSNSAASNNDPNDLSFVGNPKSTSQKP